MSYAEVAVDAPVRGTRTFTYEIPGGMNVAPGQMVQVPFGPRRADGVVVALSDTTNIDPVKPLAEADPLGPLLTERQLALARWISDYYDSSIYAALALMLPPGSRNRTTAVVARPSKEALASVNEALREQILAQFTPRRQQVEEGAFRNAVGRRGQRELERLFRKGVIERRWGWKQLRKPPGTHGEVAEAPKGWPAYPPTAEQRQALDAILPAIDGKKHDAFLLHGVTGSGKTEVYLQALARCVAQGRKAVVLVPEISLTPQMVERFTARFPGKVAALHSRLPLAEQRRTWWRTRGGQVQVVIGSRSALFAPMDPLGLIVLDEEHEWTYKQQDASPRYHARSVALRCAQQQGAVLLLGSATPDVGVYHLAQAGTRIKLLSLPHRIGAGAALADVKLVDMRKELREGRRGIFSRPLQEALAATLERGEQAILFINRRGDSGIVQCRDCGYVMRCASCDVPLTYHSETHRLVCHQCNRRRRPVSSCPRCGSVHIRNLGLGTQRVVKELEQLAPGVSTLRWDRDAALQSPQNDGVLEAFARGEAQVLVGTQMVTKSLDIPSVTLVGVVLADIGLHLPDFRSAERVFQLICQVAGRAGRGSLRGAAFVQTYRPEHYAVLHGAKQDYQGFYEEEIAFRRAHRLPPFSRLVRLGLSLTNGVQAEREASRMGRELSHQRQVNGLGEIDLLGPAPAYPMRVRGRYRWHIVLRGPDPRVLLDKIEVPDGWVVDVDPVSLL